MRERYDSKVKPSRFEEESGIWLHNPRKKKGRSLKLSKHWEGPYMVIKHLNDAVVRINRNARSKPKVVHVNRLKTYQGPQVFEWSAEQVRDSPGDQESKAVSQPSQDEHTPQVEELRRSKRIRKPPSRFSPSGTDET